MIIIGGKQKGTRESRKGGSVLFAGQRWVQLPFIFTEHTGQTRGVYVKPIYTTIRVQRQGDTVTLTGYKLSRTGVKYPAKRAAVTAATVTEAASQAMAELNTPDEPAL